MVFPWVSTWSYLLHRQRREEHDHSVAFEANVDRQPLPLPAGLSLQWLGTAGFALRYQGYTLLIDPYLTRSSFAQVVRERPLRVDAALLNRHVVRADAILVGHTHFDHVLDVPALARLHQCRVYGSRSLKHLLQLHGLAKLAVEVQPQRQYELGPFAVTFVPSLHAKLVLGLKVPSDGELTCEHLDALTGRHYRCGQVYGIRIRVAGVTFYHQGSANLLDEEIPRGPVDYFLVGIAGRGFTPRYTARILGALSPRHVIPHHYDDFFRPLDAAPGFSLNVHLGGFFEEVSGVSKEFSLHTLRLLQRVSGAS